GHDVPRPGGQVEHRGSRMVHEEVLIHLCHPGYELARPDVSDEGMPGGDERSGDGGDHDRVVDVGDDPEPGVVVDDEHRRFGGAGGGGEYVHLLPARGEIVGGDGVVEIPRPVGLRAVLRLPDADPHGDVAHGSGDVGTPAPLVEHRAGELLRRRRLIDLRLRLHPPAHDDATEDAHEVAIAVTGVGDRAGAPAAVAQERGEAAVDAIFDAGGEV